MMLLRFSFCCLALFGCVLLAGCNTYRTPPYPASWEIEVVELGEPEAAYLLSDRSIAVRYHIERERGLEGSGFHWLLIEPDAAAEVLKSKVLIQAEHSDTNVIAPYRENFAQVRTEQSDPKFGQMINAAMIPPILEPGLPDEELPVSFAPFDEALVIRLNEEGRVSLRDPKRPGVETRLIDLWPTHKEHQTAAGAAREKRYRDVAEPINAVGRAVTAPVQLLALAWYTRNWDRSGK